MGSEQRPSILRTAELLTAYYQRLRREKMPALNMRIDFASRKVHLRAVPGSIELRPFHWRWNIS